MDDRTVKSLEIVTFRDSAPRACQAWTLMAFMVAACRPLNILATQEEGGQIDQLCE